jgi:hypothetical protein
MQTALVKLATSAAPVKGEQESPKSFQNPQDVASPEFIANLELLFPQINAVGLQLEKIGFTVTFTPHDVLTQYGAKTLAVLPPEDFDCLATFHASRANNDETTTVQ